MRTLITVCLYANLCASLNAQSVNYTILETSKIRNTIELSSGQYLVSGYQFDQSVSGGSLPYGSLELLDENGATINSLLFDESSDIHVVGADINGEFVCIVDSDLNSDEADELALYKVDAGLNEAVFISQLDFSNISRELGKMYSFETLVRDNLLYVFGLGNIAQVGNKSFILEYDLDRFDKLNFNIISTSALTNSAVSVEYATAFYSNGDMLQVSKRLSQGTGPIISRHSIDGQELWNKELSKNYLFYDIDIDSEDNLFITGSLKIESANKTDYLGVIVKFDENGAWQKQQRISQDPSLSAQSEALVELHKIVITEQDEVYAFGMDGGGFMDFIPIIFGQFDTDLVQANISRFSNQPADPSLFQTVTKNIFVDDQEVKFFNNLEIFNGTSQGIFGVIDLDILSDIELLDDRVLTVSPSPVSSVLRIDFDDKDMLNQNVSIFNSHGQWIKTQNFETLIDVSTLNAGLYYLVIEAGSEKHIVDFIKN